MSVANARFWYVALTQPRAELKATGRLLRQGLEPYLPAYLKRRRHARRVDFVAAPLFPRYVFVSTNLTMQRWRAIHSATGHRPPHLQWRRADQGRGCDHR